MLMNLAQDVKTLQRVTELLRGFKAAAEGRVNLAEARMDPPTKVCVSLIQHDLKHRPDVRRAIIGAAQAAAAAELLAAVEQWLSQVEPSARLTDRDPTVRVDAQ